VKSPYQTCAFVPENTPLTEMLESEGDCWVCVWALGPVDDVEITDVGGVLLYDVWFRMSWGSIKHRRSQRCSIFGACESTWSSLESIAAFGQCALLFINIST